MRGLKRKKKERLCIEVEISHLFNHRGCGVKKFNFKDKVHGSSVPWAAQRHKRCLFKVLEQGWKLTCELQLFADYQQRRSNKQRGFQQTLTKRPEGLGVHQSSAWSNSSWSTRHILLLRI